MKVVLRADVENLGKKGDLCTVADGYEIGRAHV